MYAQFWEKERVDSNSISGVCNQSEILKELLLKIVNLKNISGEQIMKNIFNSEEWFDIVKVKKSFFFEESLYIRLCENMLR